MNANDSRLVNNSQQHISVILKAKRLAFKVGQYVNRQLLKDSFVARHLPFRAILFRMLTPSLNEAEIASTNRQFRENIIENRVTHLKSQGVNCVHFYVLLVESLGDIISCGPICRYLKKIALDSTINWVVRPEFADILKAIPFVDIITQVDSIGEGYEFCKRRIAEDNAAVLINCQYDNTFCRRTKKIIRNPCNPSVNSDTYFAIGNLLETFSLAAGLPPLQFAPSLLLPQKQYPKPPGLPNTYAVFHCHGADTARGWAPDKWNEIAAWLMMRGINIVEIGTSKEIVSCDPRYTDKTGRGNLLTLAAIIRDAAFFVGIDSGFSHVANALKIPSLVLLGRFSVFDRYFPYSGEFAHSRIFKSIFAEKGQYASTIRVDAVRQGIVDLLNDCGKAEG